MIDASVLEPSALAADSRHPFFEYLGLHHPS
jgi:hypothetical protein